MCRLFSPSSKSYASLVMLERPPKKLSLGSKGSVNSHTLVLVNFMNSLSTPTRLSLRGSTCILYLVVQLRDEIDLCQIRFRMSENISTEDSREAKFFGDDLKKKIQPTDLIIYQCDISVESLLKIINCPQIDLDVVRSPRRQSFDANQGWEPKHNQAVSSFRQWFSKTKVWLVFGTCERNLFRVAP